MTSVHQTSPSIRLTFAVKGPCAGVAWYVKSQRWLRHCNLPSELPVNISFSGNDSTLQTQTTQAIFELCDVEIDQDSLLDPRKFHVRN